MTNRLLSVTTSSSNQPEMTEAPMSVRKPAPVVLVILLLALALTGTAARPSASDLSTPEDFKAEFAAVPCRNEDRMAAVQALFRKLGATDADLSIDHHKSVDNVIVRKTGASADTIVVGAHYDKVARGCGAIDNWSGVVTVAHVFASLKDASMQKTVLFVAFGKEERGLVGSRAMVNDLNKDLAKHYCAMINIDSLGMAGPQGMDNTSSRKLTKLAGQTAEDLKIHFAHADLEHADADSSSFQDRGIPAITIHGITNGWESILHTDNDQSQRVNPQSVYLGYRLVLSMLKRVDAADCSAFR
jgi:hypothetical protein